MRRNTVLLILLLLAAQVALANDFVLIEAGALPGNPSVRVEAFEMQVHPVTNLDYGEFVRATGHAAPLHWRDGRIPEGMQQYPVIFVNRYDAAAYAAWLTSKTGRIHRLPTRAEFEYAARAGRADARYPWGEQLPDSVNYDRSGDRAFNRWHDYLQPAGQTPPNPWGLKDMAGNVWQMVDEYPDLATNRYVYRVTNIVSREGRLAGGSWARGEHYLHCGVTGGSGAGIRHPDIGFRLVREPAGSTHFRSQPRRVIATPAAGGAVYLGWQLLPGDTAQTGFHVYRSGRRDAAGARITEKPVTASTDYTDRSAPAGGRIYYRVRAIDAAGHEGPPSEWAGIEPGASPTGLIASIEPTAPRGGFVPVFGDLDGDGVLDAVLRLDNGIREMSRDPGVPVELEAFTSYGRSLWRRPLVRHELCFGNANNVPVNVLDLDGDGRAEVIAQIEDDGRLHLAVLEGMTGRVLRQTPWTAMVSDFAKSSTRVHMSVACLDGQRPAIVTQTGLYENEVIDAYDADLRHLWKYESFAETSGSGSHHVDIADLDGDGRDEVLVGTTALNGDGSVRWSIYRQHPDIVAVKHILPGLPGRQVYFAVESNVHAGAYVVDAAAGKIHWKLNREDDPRWQHAHIGWAADIWAGSPGMEMLTNRDGHEARDTVLFAADGRILANPFERGWSPVNWTGGDARELMTGDGTRLGRFDGRAVAPLDIAGPNESGSGSCRMVADLAGDYRDEVVCIGKNAAGNPAVLIYTNTAPATRREVPRTASREYRVWMAHTRGGGYPSYFEWQPEE